MNETNVAPKRGRGGRPPKLDPVANRITVRFTDRQYADFLSMYEQSGVRTMARFILARVFGESFRVVKIDSSMVDFVTRLTEFHGQIRAVGVNYNQTVKHLKSTFEERKALAMLYKLEQDTMEMVQIWHDVLALCDEFRAKIG